MTLKKCKLHQVFDYVKDKLPSHQIYFDTTKPIYERCLHWESTFADKETLFCHKHRHIATSAVTTPTVS